MRPYAIMIFLLWSGVFAVILLLTGIIVGTIGASIYLKNRHDEQTYRPWKTLCLVQNYTFNRCDCQRLIDCYDRCPCFEEEFLVDYEIFNKTIIRSRIRTKSRILRHKKSQEICYYDGRSNLTSVKWNYADKTLGLISFCIGYSIVILVLPIMVIILIVLHSRTSR